MFRLYDKIAKGEVYTIAEMSANHAGKLENALKIVHAAKEATGDITHTAPDQSSVLIDSAGYSPSQMKSKLWYSMKTHKHDAYSATMIIVGDPTIDFVNERYIRVINVTDSGYLHHTSGVYWIEEVTDSIQGGEMITTLKLMKNASAGDIDGVAILNPKFILK